MIGDLQQKEEALLAAESVVITRARTGCAQHIEVLIVGPNRLALAIGGGSNGSVEPTELTEVTLDVDETLVPLIQIHKVGATTAAGESPVAGGVALVEVNSFETRNYYYREPAREACGYLGG